MLYTRHFIVESIPLGSGRCDKLSVSGGLNPPQPYAFFCGRCANLWARCPVDHLPGMPREEWLVWRRPCRKCAAHSGEIPGSLMLPWEESFNRCLAQSRDALLWEFQRHMEFAERQTE